MKDVLEFLRGSVRPVVTYILVGALVGLVFLHPADLLDTFKATTALCLGYWYGSRSKGTI